MNYFARGPRQSFMHLSGDVKEYLSGANAGFLARGISLLTGFVNVYLFVRILGPEGYGSYVLGWTLVTLISLVFLSGLHKGVTYRIPRILAQNQNQHAREFLNASFFLAVLFSAAGWIILYIVAAPIADFFDSVHLKFWLSALAVMIPVLNGKKILSEWLIATERVPENYFIFAITPSMLLTLMLGTIYLTGTGSAILVLVGIVVSELIPVLVAGLRELSPSLPHLNAISHGTWRYNLRMLVNDLLKRQLWRVDILFVSFFLGDLVTGGYKVALKLAKSGQLLDELTTPVIRPRIGKYLENKNLLRLHEEYDTVRFVSLLFHLLYGVFMVGVGYWLIRFFGPYEELFPVLVILVFGYALDVSFGNIGNILVMDGKAQWLLLSSSLALMLAVAGNYLFIPILGVEGAALATVLAIAVLNLSAWLGVLYYMRENFLRAADSFIAIAMFIWIVVLPDTSVSSPWSILALLAMFTGYVMSHRPLIKQFLQAWQTSDE